MKRLIAVLVMIGLTAGCAGQHYVKTATLEPSPAENVIAANTPAKIPKRKKAKKAKKSVNSVVAASAEQRPTSDSSSSNLVIPADIAISVEFREPSGNRILDGDETGALVLTVTNSGKGDAQNVVIDVELEKEISGLHFASRVPIGRIPAGGKVTKEIELRAEETVVTADGRFLVNVTEANGFDAEPVQIGLKVKSFEPPKLVVADIGIDDKSGKGRIEPMEMVELTARIQNIGRGEARQVAVDVVPGQNVFLAGDGASHFKLGNLSPGVYKDVKFTFYCNKRIPNGAKIPLSLKVAELRPRFQVAQALELVMNGNAKRTQEIMVAGIEEPRKEIQLAGGLSIDVDIQIPEGEWAGKDDVAVVIGNRNYAQAGIPNVEFADRDARVMQEYLVKTFGFQQDNIIFETDATVGKFNEIFGTEQNPKGGRLHKYVQPGKSSVFIYYVGHGAPDLETHEAFFVPVDANPQYISSNGYRLQTFYANLAKLPARKVTVVLDSCFSGNSNKGFLFKNISPAMVKVKKDYGGTGNSTVITSAALDQVSAWYPEKKHSLFTYFFLKGIQGAADADGDRKITMAEMKRYLQDNVPRLAQRLSGVEQQPMVTGNSDDVLVVLKK